MLNILLVESALELIPQRLWEHPEIKRYCKRFNKSKKKVLLDISYHFHAMHKLENWEKRGRPDIVHISLLNALESPLNKKGLLRIWVHTINDEIIEVKPETRIPRNYERFKGVIEDLLFFGQVPPNKKEWLMRILDIDLKEFLKRFDEKILLETDGKNISPRDFALYLKKFDNPIILIGGFQKGKVSENIRELCNEVYKISTFPLMTLVVVYEIIANYENVI